MKKTHLIIIDPQNDFCTPLAPGADPITARFGFEKASLLVKGADADMDRLAKFIVRNQRRLAEIDCTLDSHQAIHIAHPPFWRDSNGNPPTPFTLITSPDVRNGTFRPFNPKWQARAQAYVDALAVDTKDHKKRYDLCVWPLHCLIGTWGHAIVPEVAAALYKWEVEGFNRVNYVSKGSNFFTEHYSALMADVPDPSDASTKLNVKLIDKLLQADEILITGEALSHCVANSIRDIANNFGEEHIQKFVLLEDTTSNVGGFEKMGEDFVKEMVARGMKRTTTKDW